LHLEIYFQGRVTYSFLQITIFSSGKQGRVRRPPLKMLFYPSLQIFFFVVVSLRRSWCSLHERAEAQQQIHRRHQRYRLGIKSPQRSTRDHSPSQRGRSQLTLCRRSQRRRGSRHGRRRSSLRGQIWLQNCPPLLHDVARWRRCTGRTTSEQHPSRYRGDPSTPNAGEPPPTENKSP